MMKRLTTLCLGVGLATSMACVPGDIDGPSEDVAATGLTLTIDMQGNTDVAGVRYEIAQCGQANAPFKEETRDLEDLTLPGGIPSFLNKPFDAQSNHLFADYFTVLNPGCYDLTATPVQSDGTPSEMCRPIQSKGVQVESGLTTEILMVSQCDGLDKGAVDLVTALNLPPRITKLQYHPSKFPVCSQYGPTQVVLCATAEDPDQDPMLFDWDHLKGPRLLRPPNIVHSAQQIGVHTECVMLELKPSRHRSEEYLFKVTAFDQFPGHDGLQTAETWFQKNGYGNIKSRSTLKIPLYVSCDKRCQDDKPNELLDMCPRSQGFWKNHPHHWPEGADMIPLFNQTTWSSVLHTPPQGNRCNLMGIQYVAAMLNVGYGALSPEHIGDLLDEAEQLFAQCPYLTQPQRERAEELRDLFERINLGESQSDQCLDIDEILTRDANNPFSPLDGFEI